MKKQRRQNMHFCKKVSRNCKERRKTQHRTLCKYTCGTEIYIIIPSLIKDCQ